MQDKIDNSTSNSELGTEMKNKTNYEPRESGGSRRLTRKTIKTLFA
jgi:hypothetical protein